MAEHLVLRMEGSADQANMVIVNDAGQLLSGPEMASLATVAEHAGERQVTVMLPANEVVGCLAEVPAASPSRLRQMLPFSLEDEFAEDIEGLHFAPGDRNKAGSVAVSVISRERLRFWISALRTAGIDARQIVSEADAMADTPGTVTLYLEGRKILGRRPGHAPFLFEELTLSELWQLLEAESNDKDDLSHVVLFVDAETRAARQPEIDQWRDGVADLEIKELLDGCLPHLAARLIAQPGPNLLQGEYAARSDFAVLLRPWRTAAGFLLALVAFSLVGKAAEVWKLGHDDAQLEVERSSVCAASYSSMRPDGCENELQRRLVGTSGSRGGNSGFLEIMSIVGKAGGDALQIDNISYRDGGMVLEIVVPSIPYLEAFVQGIANAGPYTASPGTTESVANGYEVRVEIVPT